MKFRIFARTNAAKSFSLSIMMTEGNSAFAMSQLKFNTLSLSSTDVEQSITREVSWA